VLRQPAYRSRLFTLALSCAAFAAAVNFGAPRSFATMLNAGDSILAPGEPDPIGAHLVFTTGPVPIVAPSYTGTLTSSVYDMDSGNTSGSTALTFTYQITNFVGSLHDLHRFTVSSFANFTTDVSYFSPTAGAVPTFIDRNPAGDVVGFSYPITIPGVFVGTPIAPGVTSALMVIQTDAQLYKTTLASVINGSVTMVLSLAPDRLVPEPSTLTLGAMGLVGTAIVALRRRRRR